MRLKTDADIEDYNTHIVQEDNIDEDAAGGYMTKLKTRKATKQDLTSPTGFESSPKPNMYTKTMKFKIVKPSERLNSTDLWTEGVDDAPTTPDQDTVTAAFEKWNREIHYLYWKPVTEWDEYDLSNWNSLVRKDGQYNESKSLREARYSQFRKNAEKRSPKEQLHKAVREIQIKMDEVNKLVDFTSRMKQELKESEEELKYLKRTKNSLFKIQEKIQYISNKIKTITE